MKRIIRFIFIVIVMQGYYFAYTFFLSPILENFLYEGIGILDQSAMTVFALAMQAVAAVIFIVLYINLYIAVPEHKREFLKRMAEETAGYNMKADIIYYIEENNGNIDVLIYGVYSILFPVSIWFFGGSSPFSFLYFPQLIFYWVRLTNISIVVDLVFCYMCSMIFFIIGYVAGVALLHRKWYKNRLRK